MTSTIWTSGESMSGFEDAEFRILWETGSDSTELPAWSRQSYVVTNHIPGSDITETDALGSGEWVRSYRAEVEDKYMLATLRGLQQSVGRLRVPAAMNDLVDADVVEEMIAGDLYARIDNVFLKSVTDERISVNGTCSAMLTFTKEPADG